MKKGAGGRIIIIFIFCCHLVGVLLFCKGFLLKRVVVPEHSKCSRDQGPGHTPSPLPPAHTTLADLPSCNSYQRPFKRVLWLLIDALRYDFMLYDDTLVSPPIYRNKMPYIRDLLRTQPANARLFKFIADPPTTTMQRLKALTTGSLPTFIDIGSNFNSYAISEDSLVYQAKLNRRNVTFIGDDTWLGLYPNMMTKTYDYPSLNVKDLDTVDNGVMEHLGSELSGNDAEILIGHMLGVDHVGHTYGPSHWTMGQKLTQMNSFIEDIFTHHLDEGTVVFVLGDHGMNPAGDHGGETDLETNAALLVYSLRPLFDPSESPIGREIFQIDLVPTVAMALGLPIPFSNLGMIIPEVFLPFSKTGNREAVGGDSDGDGYSGRVTSEFLMALRTNAEQIHNYLATYSQYSGDFSTDTLHMLEDGFGLALGLHQRLLETEGGREPSQRELTYIATKYITYMKEVKGMCQRIWAKFDDVPMVLGFSLLFPAVVTSLLMLVDVNKATLYLRHSAVTGLKAGIILTSISLIFTGIETSFFGFLILVTNYLLFSLLSIIFVFIWNFKDVLIKLLTHIQLGISSFMHQFDFLKLLALVVILLYALSMLSNSFILYEADMLAFFIQSLVLFFAVRNVQKELRGNKIAGRVSLLKSVIPHLLLMVWIRVSKLFYACRDLQLQDGCESTTFILPLASAAEFLGPLAKWRLVISSLAVVLTPIALIVYLQRSDNYRFLSSSLVAVIKFGFPVSSVCVVIYWVIQTFPRSTLLSLAHWQHVLPPQIVYVITATIIVLCVVYPFKRQHFPSIKFLLEEREANNSATQLAKASHGDTNPTSRFRKFDHSESPITNSKQQTVTTPSMLPSIATLVAMVFSILIVSLWIPIAMVLNDGLALSALLTALQVFLTLKFLRNSEKGVSWEACVLWGLLGCHSFFSFGHHATVTSLRFEAGFVGIQEITSYNLPLAASLVGLNMLASQILYGLGFPLMVILWTRANGMPSDQLLKPMLSYVTLHSFRLLITMVAASMHRRHLMVWWVFTPRFLYEAAFQAVTDISMILGFTLVKRLEHILSAASN